MGAQHFSKLAAWELPLPVTACGTGVKRNITELRGEKKNHKENEWEGRILRHNAAINEQKKKGEGSNKGAVSSHPFP